jgi:hypothetical protein
MKAQGPWPSSDKASAFYCHEKEKAEDPGFKSPRARHPWQAAGKNPNIECARAEAKRSLLE